MDNAKPKKARERFKRELQRMREEYDCYFIVIEGYESDIIDHCRYIYKKQYPAYLVKKRRGYKCRQPMRPEVRAKSVLGSLKSMRVDFQCPYYFMGNRAMSAEFVEEAMEYYMRKRV